MIREPPVNRQGSPHGVADTPLSAVAVAACSLALTAAPAASGTAYVTELFAGRISRMSRTGQVSTAAKLAAPLSVEVDGGYLYAGTLAPMKPETGELFGSGSVVQLRR